MGYVVRYTTSYWDVLESLDAISLRDRIRMEYRMPDGHPTMSRDSKHGYINPLMTMLLSGYILRQKRPSNDLKRHRLVPQVDS
jgi:hypothetical protein